MIPGGRRRLSTGGQLVELSLRKSGFLLDDTSRPLVETATPASRPFSAILAQNAWTVISPQEFHALSQPYPWPHVARHLARRGLAQINLRRCASRYCLSESMQAVMRKRGFDAAVVPVTLPLDVCGPLDPRPPAWMADQRPFVLVPGTITWYKGTDRVAGLLRRSGRTDLRVVLAGDDDGSGCLENVLQGLSGWDVRIGRVTRPEMQWLLLNAETTLIPSRLESLSFSMAEALALSRAVVASPLPVHVEVAKRIGRAPTWLDHDTGPEAYVGASPSGPHLSDEDRERFANQWLALGRAMSLARMLSSPA